MIKSIPIALAIAAVLAVAGCGSSSNSSSSGEGGAYGGGNGESTASKEAKSEAAAATPVSISVGSAPEVGKVLVDSKGFTLYYFEKDKKGGKSACYGACAEGWPPLTGTGKAEGGAMSSELGTTKRSDGTTQVTYAGWPLYTFVGDSKPGEANGTDSKAFGASWYPLHPNGEKAGH